MKEQIQRLLFDLSMDEKALTEAIQQYQQREGYLNTDREFVANIIVACEGQRLAYRNVISRLSKIVNA